MPQTWTSDGSVANIQNIIDNLAAAGDTITLPVGTFTWTSPVGVTKAVIIQGATTTTGNHTTFNTTPMTANDQTILLDNIDGGAEYVPFFNLVNTSGVAEISGITFKKGVAKALRFTGAVLLDSTYPGKSHLHHCHFDGLINDSIATTKESYSVVDHCLFEHDQGRSFVIQHTNVAGQPYGDVMWNRATNFGGADYFFAEDNYILNRSGGAQTIGCVDAFGGAKCTFRYNRWVDCIITDHGTETTGRQRGVRSCEVYNNTFHNDGRIATSSSLLRGGTFLAHDNAWTGTQWQSAGWGLENFRSFLSFIYWGTASGYNPFDLNSTVDHTGNGLGGGTNGKIVSGATCTSAVNSTTNPSGSSATVNVSNNLGSTDLTGKQISIVGGGSTFILSNTATSITFRWLIESDLPTGNMPIAIGNSYLVYDQPTAEIDQPGRGQGDLISGVPPLPNAWPNEALEPCFAWNNTFLGNSFSALGQITPTCIENRDFYNRVPAGGEISGYTGPYVYPHPLVSTDVTPPVVSITAPISGATIFGSAATISASATDNVAMAGVTFKRGTTTIGAEVVGAGPTYSISWDTTLLTNGSYTLHAIGRDTSNNTTDVSIPVTVTNSDVTPPVVAFTAPAAAAIVANTVPVSATANDNVAVAGVTFKYGTTVIGSEVTSPPYTVNWNTTMVANGAYTLHAIGRDTSNNTTDVTRSVTVTNTLPPDPPPPEPVKKKGEKEGDATQIPLGAQSLMVAFESPTPDTDYQFEELEVENIHNSDPLILTPVITEMTTDGFTVAFNGTPDTTQYFLRWKIIA